MGLLDIFKNDAFGTLELTDAFNVKPNMYGRLNELNLFPSRPVRTRTVAIERKNFVLNVLPFVPVGGPASKGIVGKRDLRSVTIPHIPHEDNILAEEVQGVRSFGSENMLESVQDLTNEKLNTMTDKHDITLEYLRVGAMKGIILDSTGDPYLNLFDEFGIAEESESFDLTNTNTVVLQKVTLLKRFMETHLFGDTMSGIQVLCSPSFWDAFVNHTSVEKAFQFYQTTYNLAGDYRKGFTFGGVTFEEYHGTATRPDGTVIAFIDDGTARAFPTGSQSFRTYFAPADFIETVNTPGLPRYAKQRIMDFDRGIEIHTQSNPLPICLRPQLLVELTIS